ncbi:MAG: ThuA domain-containing protein [Verrucomicrobiota bacterium]
MKKLPLILSTTALFSSALVLLQSQEEKPKTWPEKAAARFGEKPTADQRSEIEASIPDRTADPKKARKVLVFWRCEGFIHTSIPFGNHAMKAIAEQTEAFSADFADTYDVFSNENLAQYDAIIFNNTTHLKPNDEQRAAILDFIHGGKGIVGFHAAADNFGGWDEGIALIGGIFNGHPWNAGGTWAYKVEDPTHELNAAFGGNGFWHRDEIYWYRPENFEGRDKLRVLLSLDMSHEANLKPLENEKNQANLAGRLAEGEGPADVDVPVSWCRDIGEGRLFFTNLGHVDMTFANTMVLQHMLDGIQYAMGDIEADATPSAKVDVEIALAPEQPAK